MSPAAQLLQSLGLEHDPKGDAFGFPWSSWTRVPPRAASVPSSPARKDTQRPVKPPTAVGGRRVTAGEHQLELAL